MKILGFFLNDEIRTGGHKRYLELVRGLARKGHVVVLLKNRKLDLAAVPGLSFVSLSRPERKPWYSFSLGYVIEILRRRKEVLAAAKGSGFIVAFGETNFPAAFVLRLLTGAKILFAFRTSVFEDLSGMGNAGMLRRGAIMMFYRFREALIGRCSAFLVFQSENDRTGFTARNAPKLACKTRVIRNNIDASWFAPEYADTNAGIRLEKILFLGSFNERKGVMVLLDAFRRLRNREVTNCRLFLAGFGVYEEKIRDFIAANDLEGAVLRLGRTNTPFELLRETDLLVVPSLFDSYPNVALEALHTGAPVIGSGSGGIPDILRYDELLFEPGNPEALCEKLFLLATDERLYERVRALCRERKGHFLFDWIGEFEKVLAAT